MATYIPFWKRPPNIFIKYEDRPFVLPVNAYNIVKSGTETMAIFKDRNGKTQEMSAFIRWNED